jgi:oligopeptide/dipeptide ABC transporter ATP-binding protein
MTGTPLLEIESMSVSYKVGRGRRQVAAHGVDLAVPRGRTVGLVGESGSGKTSVGAAVLGLAPVTAGRVRFDGEDITHATGRDRRRLSRRMQVIFQDPYGSLNPSLSIGETLGEGLRFGRGVAAAEARRRVARVLDEVGLPGSAADRYPAHFSGGQRQRVAIARAVITDPEFVVCDEPVSALDLSIQAQVLNLLARLQADRGLGYLFISHDIAVVRHVCDEIAVMYRGHIVERGPTAAVAGAPVHPYTRALLAAAPVPDPDAQAAARAARRRLTAVTAPEPGTGCVFAARCPAATGVCRSAAPPLRDRTGEHRVACHHQDDVARTVPEEAR